MSDCDLCDQKFKQLLATAVKFWLLFLIYAGMRWARVIPAVYPYLVILKVCQVTMYQAIKVLHYQITKITISSPRYPKYSNIYLYTKYFKN